MKKEQKRLSNKFRIVYFMLAIWIAIGAYDYYTTVIEDFVSRFWDTIYLILILVPTQFFAYLFGGILGNTFFNYKIWAGVGFIFQYLLWILLIEAYKSLIRMQWRNQNH